MLTYDYSNLKKPTKQQKNPLLPNIKWNTLIQALEHLTTHKNFSDLKKKKKKRIK